MSLSAHHCAAGQGVKASLVTADITRTLYLGRALAIGCICPRTASGFVSRCSQQITKVQRSRDHGKAAVIRPWPEMPGTVVI